MSGVLYYFPFQNDQETVPAEVAAAAKPSGSPFGHHAAAGGRGTQMGLSQLPPRATQHAPRGTQMGGGGAGGSAAAGGIGGLGNDEEDEEEAPPGGWQLAPIFEAFWQGRLIPGARIDTLPFVEAVRQKRTAQAKVCGCWGG